MISYLRKATVTQRYCPLCCNEDVSVTHEHEELPWDGPERISYFVPVIICPDHGHVPALEWVTHADETVAYVEGATQ